MIPRIQFRYVDGQEEGPMPNHVFRETFCNPESFCSPVCCCCGILSVQTAVKALFILSFVFSIWEICMGIWLLIGSYQEVEIDPGPDSSSTELNLKLSMGQLHRLIAASWIIIGAGLFRLSGVVYLLYVVWDEDRRRKLPATFCISLSAVTGLILLYPVFIQIPGKGLVLKEGSQLIHFGSIYVSLHVTDLLVMGTYSLYSTLYYVLVNSHERHWSLQRARFDNIDTQVALM